MLTKVIFEYSDGRRRYIEGEEAIKWSTFCEQVSLYAHNRGMNPPWDTIRWKEEGPISNEKKSKEDNKEEGSSEEDKET